VKERESYRCTEWWIRRGRSDGWRIGQSEMEELIP